MYLLWGGEVRRGNNFTDLEFPKPFPLVLLVKAEWKNRAMATEEWELALPI